MEESTAPQASPAKVKPKRRRWLLRLSIASLLLILAFILFCFVATFEDGKIAWYTQSEFDRAVKPNLITRMKNVVLNWNWTQRFQKPSPQVTFETSRFTLPIGSDSSIVLGPAAATNFDGMRLWVLPPEERDQLIQRIKSQPECTVIKAPGITTLDGRMFETIAPDANSTNANQTISGLVIDCLPKVSADSIKLLPGITEVENLPASLAASASPSTKMKFVIGCRASIHNGGALLVALGDSKGTNPVPSFIIISAYLINPDGTRIVDNPKPSK